MHTPVFAKNVTLTHMHECFRQHNFKLRDIRKKLQAVVLLAAGACVELQGVQTALPV